MMWEIYCKDLSEYFDKHGADEEKLRMAISQIIFQGWELVTVADKVAYFKRPSTQI